MAQPVYVAASQSPSPITGVRTSCQLTDSTLVYVAYDSSATAWALYYTSDRVTATKIADLSAAFAPTVQPPALCRDYSDNVFVIGVNTAAYLVGQAFAKGAGHTWTAKTVVTLQGSALNHSVQSAFWSSVGGTSSAGQVVYAARDQYGYPNVFATDAGALLAGTTPASATDDTLSTGYGTTDQTNFDMVADGGVGATHCWVLVAANSANLYGYYVTITATAVTSVQVYTSATTAANAKCRIARYASGAALYVINDSGSLAYGELSTTASIVAKTSLTAPTGFYKASGSLTHDISSPPGSTKLWVHGFNAGALVRFGITPGTTPVVDTTLVTDQTAASPWMTANPTFPAPLVHRTPSASYVDVQAVQSGSLYGTFLVFAVAPNAPTLTTPANSSTLDNTITQRLSWTFSSTDGTDVESAFDLRYSSNGGSTWTTISGSTLNTYVDVTGGTFAAGSYQWQVRSYGSTGLVGPYSASNFFTAATPPSTPTITAPTSGATVGTNPATVTWTATSQTAYEVRTVADASGVANPSIIYYDTGAVSNAVTRSSSVPFVTNGQVEHIQVRIQNGGLWSSWADITITVSYAAPWPPLLVLAQVGASLGVTITNTAAGGGYAAAVSNDVYYSANGDPLVRVATGLPINTYWVYEIPASGVVTIQVVATASSGATAVSA